MQTTKVMGVIFCVALVTVSMHAAEIHDAARAGDLVKVKQLIESDPALVNLKDENGFTPFYHAALMGNRGMLECLLAHGANTADLEMRDRWGRTPLCAVARDGGNVETIKLLLSLGANVNAADRSGWTPIMLAAWRPYPAVVELLLDANAELNIHTPDGERLLADAIAAGIEKLFDRMVEKGVSLDFLNRDGGTLLHAAAAGGTLRIVQSLVGRGLDVNRKDKYGWVPLHIAAEQGQKETISFLIKKGADINARNMLGQTAYNIAQEREDHDLADFLSSLKADDAASKFPKIKGRYLGRQKPGLQPEEFAPGIVSHRYRPHSTVAVSPKGDEIFWNPMIEARGGGYSYGYIMTIRLKNGFWSYPQRAPFSKKEFRDDHPFFSADGKKLYFLSRRALEGSDSIQNSSRTWYVEKEGNGWSGPKLFASLPIPAGPQVTFLTFSFDKLGNYYYAQDGDIYCSRYSMGEYLNPEKLGEGINSDEVEMAPLISVQGDWLIFSRGGQHPYVSFKKSDGTWTMAVNAQDKIGQAINFTLSGDFLMVGGDRWVDARVIDALRPIE